MSDNSDKCNFFHLAWHTVLVSFCCLKKTKRWHFRQYFRKTPLYKSTNFYRAWKKSSREKISDISRFYQWKLWNSSKNRRENQFFPEKITRKSHPWKNKTCLGKKAAMALLKGKRRNQENWSWFWKLCWKHCKIKVHF